MNKENKIGKIQTIHGLIDKNELGIVLPHEHIMLDVAMATPGKFRQIFNFKFVNNFAKKFTNNDVGTMVKELADFKHAGGNAIVDLTPRHMRGNIKDLQQISELSNVQIIVGTANYFDVLMPSDVKEKTVEDIAHDFITDITVGIQDTKAKAGVIGEIGVSYPITENEIKNLRAAALAHKKTGAVISTHTGFHPKSPNEIVDILFGENVDPKSIIIGHIEYTYAPNDIAELITFAKRGTYIAFDSCGTKFQYKMPANKYTSDEQRANSIYVLVSAGFEDQILISHDYVINHYMTYKGGEGYKHAITTFVDLLRKKGLTENQIKKITISNPANALAFKQH